MRISMEGVAIRLLFCFLFVLNIYAAELDIISDTQFLTSGDTLVSRSRIFELGFFRPNNSENRYLGIWFKNVSVRTVVWVANRDQPLPDTPPLVVRITDSGALSISNNISIIWSSNTTSSQKATAKLLDTGNLVVTDELFGTILWQSFDYPTDTLLPGMKLGKDYSRGMEWHLSSWNSSQDPARGAFAWQADTLGYPDFELKDNGVVKHRGGPWRNERFSGISIGRIILTFVIDVVIIDTEVSYSYYIENNTSILSKLTMNSSGVLESMVWVEESKKWQTFLSFPRDACDAYNVCGGYGRCTTVSLVEKSCDCFDQYRFVPKDDDSSGGCVRRTPLDCKNGSVGFIKYSNIKLPDTKSTWFNTSMSMENCAKKCLQNCSCMAYADTQIRGEGTGCLMWINDLIDIRVLVPVGGRDIFIRTASSEIGSSSDPAGPSDLPSDPRAAKEKEGSKIKIILLTVFPGILLIGFIILLLTWMKKKHAGQTVKGKVLDQSESVELPLFSFSTIADATANFSPENKIGEGGFGPVYKGVLEEGLQIAVKRLSKTSNQGVDEFKNEVICISKLQHRNLVKLLGCCIEGDERLLIYEYMPNGSLDCFIFDKKQGMLLDWTKRFDIIKGISKGLVYLHQDSRLRIIHRDLKASNILLDMNMNPKISDFGIARRFGGNETQANTDRVVGTYGYMSPEYALDGIFSIKSDVFSFGVLVIEIVSGNRTRGFMNPENGNNLIGHAWSLYNEGRSLELIDTSLVDSCNPPEVLRSIQVGLLCVQQNAGDRPNMSSVILMLGNEGELPQPKQPAFFMEKDLLIADFSSSNPAGSINSLTVTEVDPR